nr:hypothetical transcript [Hymenolepis microstoma]
MHAFNFILFFCLFTLVNSQSNCKGFGKWCDGTVFNRCCGDLQCELSGAFNGSAYLPLADQRVIARILENGVTEQYSTAVVVT